MKNIEASTIRVNIPDDEATSISAAAATSRFSDPDLDHVSTMEPAMYIAAKVGDVEFLKRSTKSSSEHNSILDVFTPEHNSVLHIAALFHQYRFAKRVLELAEARASLVQNDDGDTPLHIAARSGDLEMVDLFIMKHREPLHLSHLTNSYGNTALHEALICNRSKVALRLLDVEPMLASVENRTGESPLYLSVQMGIGVVWRKLIHMDRDMISRSGPNGQTALHAAAMVRGTDIAGSLYKVLKVDRRRRDRFGRTALHYAASNPSSSWLSRLLLETDTKLAYIRDEDQLTPLLTAVRLKNWTVFNIILNSCPDCAELSDSNGQNVLHLIISYNLNPSEILENSELLQYLVRKRDKHGDTPLHLAVKAQFLEGITSLLQYRGVYLRTGNFENDTALDLIETWNLDTLKTQYMQELISQGATRNGKGLGSESLVNNKLPLNDLKQLAGILLIVSTLISTICFTAAFMIPGGYSQLGRAVLGKKVAFQAFLISDVTAVCSSIACGYMITRGLIGHIFLRSAMKIAVRFLTVALITTMVAFSTGLYVVTEKTTNWLAISIVAASCSIPVWLRLNGHRILTRLPVQRKMIDQSNTK